MGNFPDYVSRYPRAVGSERESTLPSEEVVEIDRAHGVELGFVGPGAWGKLCTKLNIKWPHKHTLRGLPGPEGVEP